MSTEEQLEQELWVCVSCGMPGNGFFPELHRGAYPDHEVRRN